MPAKIREKLSAQITDAYQGLTDPQEQGSGFDCPLVGRFCGNVSD